MASNASFTKTPKKEKYLKIPKTLREGWADVTRSTPSSPDSSRTSPLRTANELSRSVNFLINVHGHGVDSPTSGSSGSSMDGLENSPEYWGDRQNVPRKASLQPTPKLVSPEEMPRRSSLSRLFESGGGRRSPHSSVGNLLTAVLAKTVHKKYVAKCLVFNSELMVSSELFGFDIDFFFVFFFSRNEGDGIDKKIKVGKKWREEPAGRLDEFTSSWPLSHGVM